MKRATLERSDLKSKNIGLRLNWTCLAKKYFAQSSRWCFTSAHFYIFFKPTEIEPVKELSRVARFVKLAKERGLEETDCFRPR